MTKYIALLDGEPGTYGISIPDCPGCVAMGDSELGTLRTITESAIALGASD